MFKWSTERNECKPPDPPPKKIRVPYELAKLPLSKKLDEMAIDIENHDVILIESPTGSGKSVLVSKRKYYVQNVRL